MADEAPFVMPPKPPVTGVGTSQPFNSKDIPAKPPEPPPPPLGLSMDCRDPKMVRLIRNDNGSPTVLAQLTVGDVMELLRMKMERQAAEADKSKAQASAVLNALDNYDEDGRRRDE